MLELQLVPGLQAQGVRPRFGIDGKQRIHLGRNPDRGLISRVEFDRVEELAPRMRSAGDVHQAFAAHVIVGPRDGNFARSPADFASLLHLWTPLSFSISSPLTAKDRIASG